MLLAEAFVIHSFPWPVLVLVIVIVLLIRTSKQHRRHSQETDIRLCPACGVAHPTSASFCRRCGRRLDAA